MPETDPDIASALVDRLSDNADVAAMVADRIYPVDAEQRAALPYIVYLLEDEETLMTQDGESALAKATFVIWSVTEEFKVSKRLANRIRVALSGFRGTLGVHTVAGIFPVTKRDVPIPPRSGEERAEAEVAARYDVHWYPTPAAIGVP